MLNVRPLGFALGAEITGIDLSAELSDPDAARIKAAWLEHSVLCFPGQDLSPQQQVAFSSRFGEVDESRLKHLALDGNPGVSLIANKPVMIANQTLKATRADGWHSDLSFSDRPGTATFLLAKHLPPVGGDTMFASMYRAFETLSPKMAEIAESIEAVHDVAFTIAFSTLGPELQTQRLHDYPPIVHPLVRAHPETGRRSLFLSTTIRQFVGMSAAETRPLREYLTQHATRYEFVYRHRWTIGDFLMWDNRCTMHYAVPDFDPTALRGMQRSTLIPAQSGYLYAGDTEARFARA